MKHYRFTEEILVRMNEEVKYFILNKDSNPTVRSCSDWSGTSNTINHASKSTIHNDLVYRFKYFVDFFPSLFDTHMLSYMDDNNMINGLRKADIIKFIELNSHLLVKPKNRGPIKLANIYMLTEENYNIIRDIMMNNKKECTCRGGMSTKYNFLRKKLDKAQAECC